MTERAEYLIAVVGADVTNFRRGMQEVRKELGVLDSQSENTLARVGRNMTLALSAPLTVGASFAVNAASDFEAAMRNVNSIAFLSENQFQNLSEEIYNFGKTTRGGATEAANALYTIYSAGLAGEEAMYTMRAAVAASEAGLSDIGVTAEGLAAVMLAYGIDTEEGANRASDALTRMVQVGVGSMQAFVGSTSTFIPAASALGVDFAEAFGLNALLTQLAYSPSEAAVRVNAAMRSMLKPTVAMQQAFRELGVKTTSELIAKFGGLHEALIAIRNTTDGSAEAVFELFGETRAVQGVLALTNNIETSRDALRGFMEGMDGATEAARNQQMLSFAYQWDILSSAINAAAIKIGSVLTPVLIPIMTHIREMAIAFTNLDLSTIALGVSVAGLVAAIAPMLWLLPSVASPLGVLTAGFIAFGQEIQRVIAQVEEKTGAISTTIIEPLMSVVDAFKSAFDDEYKFQLSFEFDTQDPNTVGNTLVRNGKEYIVKSGDTLWDIWRKEFSEFPTFEDFITATGLTDTMIQPNQVIRLDSMVESIAQETTSVESAIYTLNERLTNGFNAAWQAIQAQIPNIQTAASTVASVLSTSLSNLVNSIASGLGSFFGTNGNNLLDKLKGGIDAFFSFEWATDLAENANTQNIVTSFSNLFVSLRDRVLPAIAETAGYISGKVVTLIGRGINYAFQWLLGGGSTEALDGLQDYVSLLGDSFQGGFEQATVLSNLGGLENSIVDSITAMLNNVADAFEPSSVSDETPAYRAMRGAFSYLFTGGLSEDIENSDSPILAAFRNLLDSVGVWLQTNGVPTISRSLGYLIGAVGSVVQIGIQNLWSLITGEGNLEAAASGLGESVLTPFMEGVANARQDFGTGSGAPNDLVGNILTGLAGAIALGAVGKFALFGVAARGIGMGLSTALSVFTPFASMAWSIASGLVSTGVGILKGGLVSLFTSAWAAFSATSLGAWATAAASGIAASLSSALLATAGTVAPLSILLSVSGSTDRNTSPDFIHAKNYNPIDLRHAGVDWTIPKIAPDNTVLSGMGGWNDPRFNEIIKIAQRQIDATSPWDLPLDLQDFRITITGTPEQISTAQIQWDEYINPQSADLRDIGLVIPFSELFTIIPLEGYELADYVLNEHTALEAKNELYKRYNDLLSSGYGHRGIGRIFSDGYRYGVPEFFPYSSYAPTKGNPNTSLLDSVAGNIRTPTLWEAFSREAREAGIFAAEELQTSVELTLLNSPLDPSTLANSFATPMHDVVDNAYGSDGYIRKVWQDYGYDVESVLANVEETTAISSKTLPTTFSGLAAGLRDPITTIVTEINRITTATREAMTDLNTLSTWEAPAFGTEPVTPAATPEPVSTSSNTTTNVTFQVNNPTFNNQADINNLVREFKRNGYNV